MSNRPDAALGYQTPRWHSSRDWQQTLPSGSFPKCPVASRAIQPELHVVA